MYYSFEAVGTISKLLQGLSFHYIITVSPFYDQCMFYYLVFIHCPYLSFFRCSKDRLLCHGNWVIFFRQKLFNLVALFKDQYLLSQKYSTLVASVFSCSPKKLDWKAIPSIWSNFWIHKGWTEFSLVFLQYRLWWRYIGIHKV